MLMPFGTAFIVNNVGLSFAVLPMIYLITGLCAVFLGPLVGRASDRFGKFRLVGWACIVCASSSAVTRCIGVPLVRSCRAVQ